MADETEEPKRKLIPIPVLDEAPVKGTPKFMVIGDEFIAQTDEGEVRVGMKIPSKLLPQLHERLTFLDELNFLLEIREDQSTIELLGELDIIDTNELARKFSQAYQEKEQARLGESYSSSDS